MFATIQTQTPNRASDAGPDVTTPINRQSIYSLLMDDAIEAVNEANDEVHRLEKTYRNERTEERAARLVVLSKATAKIATTLEVLAKIREVV
jgi:hypothetical protein